MNPKPFSGFGVLFVALIIAGAFFVQAVNASSDKKIDLLEDRDVASFDVNKVELPKLQFNNTQERVVVNAALSPVNITNVHVIPKGSIIHHSKEGITRVFDASGSQKIAAVDGKSQMIHTPSGVDKPATFVHRVPNNSHVYGDGNSIFVTDQAGELILVIINDNNTDGDKKMTSKNQIMSTYRGWIEYANDVIPGGITQFDAYWHVPASPPAMDYGKAVFIFNGVEPPELRYGLLQPVLAFYPYENGWNWYGEAWCYAMNPYDPDTDCITGPRISASTGDLIKGRILWSTTYNQWYVQFSDQTSGETSAIWSSLVPRHSNLEVCVVLEAKVVDDNNDMPGDIEFTYMTFQNNGVPISNVNFEGHVDQYKPSKITGLWVQEVSDPSDITLHTEN